jgi:tetratricopeptide (TPR) repeat protein/tRNA A-37 threonylcarbamoyl transferase component Bud32
MKCPECSQENPDSARFCSKCGTKFKTYEEVSLADTKALPGAAKKSVIGTTFASRYQILEELGEGGMGTVYRVTDKQIDEEVALKVLRPEIAADKRTLERFRNELKLARKITHPNVCRMYHLGVDEGLPYITMEYVRGDDLAVILRTKGPLAPKEAVTIAAQVCAGLTEAHRLGVVHRDLKPQNLMIDTYGKVRIMDFGIARSIESKGATEAGTFIGTPDYMSPEQVSGQQVDQRSDIYSLGVILFEMLTGRKPFEGETPLAIAVKQKTMEPPDPHEINPDIPEALCDIVLRCLMKSRESRYGDASALLAALMGLEKGLQPTMDLSFAQTQDRRFRSPLATHLRWILPLVVVAAIATAVGGYLNHRIAAPAETPYENFILADLFAQAPEDINRSLLEYVILRSLTASTKVNIFSQYDFTIYKSKIASAGKQQARPVLVVSAAVQPRVSGFDVAITLKHKGKSQTKVFSCKGTADYMSAVIVDILGFIEKGSGGLVTGIEGGRTFAQVATGNLDALEHFMKGEKAWGKLDSDTAYYEYRTASENDPDFSLALLRLADVQVFMENWEDARIKLELSLAKKDRLIGYDLVRLTALMARIDSKPAEEREQLRKLIEAFPFKKEYLYEFAESYFHVGDAEEAIKYYSKALELDPNYALAHNHIGYAYAWMGDHVLAEMHFKQYIELDNTANSYDSLASGYMFAGKYEEAVDALEKGITLDPELDYLYRNLACNKMLQGYLADAQRDIEKQEKITRLENTRMNVHVYLAAIELMRGNLDRASKELARAREYYGKEIFAGRLDESPVAPFWLTGVVAARKGDLKELRAMLAVLEKKIASGKVTATNYFPVYKFYLHLKVLEALLEKNPEAAESIVAEGQRIKHKMGYWDSIFNLPYFFNAYASVMISLGRPDQALELLAEAAAYNPSFPETHVNLARAHLKKGEKEAARSDVAAALKLLEKADQDLVLVSDLDQLRQQLR